MARRRKQPTGAVPLSVLLDEGVPVSVARQFELAGYQALRHNDVLASGASDLRVAQAAMAVGAVLIAIDNDMKRIAGRYGSGDPKYARLNLIKISCQEPLAASRVRQAMSLIELEWQFANLKKARRLYLEIGAHHIRTLR